MPGFPPDSPPPFRMFSLAFLLRLIFPIMLASAIQRISPLRAVVLTPLVLEALLDAPLNVVTQNGEVQLRVAVCQLALAAHFLQLWKRNTP